MSLALVWSRDAVVLHGPDGAAWQDGQVTFPVSFPGRKTEAVPLTLRSAVRDDATLETLTGVRFYLVGADVPIVQEVWPYYGDVFTPARPELNGGFEVSFDSGRSWIRFDRTTGYAADPATWVLLPAGAVGLAGQDGVLGPFDQAHLLTRYVIPPQAAQFQVFDVQLAVDVDIV